MTKRRDTFGSGGAGHSRDLQHGRGSRRCRTSVVSTLIAAMAVVGCEPAMSNPHDHGGGMVDEYRPAWKPVERRAPGSTVYVLWRWQPVPRGSTASATGPTAELLGPATPSRRAPVRRRTERAMEVVEVTLTKGQALGFRRRPDGQLIAVAGPTTRPLAAGHYCWHLLPGNPMLGADRPGEASARQTFGPAVVVIAVVAAVAGLIALPFAIDHVDHHAHLVKTIGQGVGGVGAEIDIPVDTGN